MGCRSIAPIYVWQPPHIEVEPGAVIAVAPLATEPTLALAIESAVLQQRPAARSDFAMVTSKELLEASPVRLASTAALYSDLAAIQSAQAVGADIVLCGQVVDCNIDWQQEASTGQPDMKDPNRAGLQAVSNNQGQTFLERLFGKEDDDPGYYIVLSWNVIQAKTGKSLGSREFRITSREAVEKYPDLKLTSDEHSKILLTAVARDTWKSIAPSVEKEEVRLASPIFQFGTFRTRLGVRAAQQGRWEAAENYWQNAAWWPGYLAPAAHHNLAVALAAREDFSAAKRELLEADGPMSIRLPGETLVWLDQRHRLYNKSHRMAEPANGWAFPDVEISPGQITEETHSVGAVSEFELPWWKSIEKVESVDSRPEYVESK